MWKIKQKHFFNQNARLVSASFHRATKTLTVGFASGVFGIWELQPEFTQIHTLSISQQKITSVCSDERGEWIAFGCATVGQLIVWEWQSESYILKQQGHHRDVNAITYSPDDAKFIATGAQDGKVKLWNTESGFCFVTFTQHTAAVTSVIFSRSNVLFSASLDGSVRAFDTVRYRNFKTFTSPKPVQFNCVTVDPSGEVVCAGSLDSFEVYVWNVVGGNLIDIYTGHTGPVSCLAFSPAGDRLVSGSWDKVFLFVLIPQSIRVWDVFSRDRNDEMFTHRSEVLSVAYSPDGTRVATSTLGGSISFWDIDSGSVVGVIEGKPDLLGGRLEGSKTAAKNSHFNSIAYNADGSCIIGGGDSKYVCLYDVESKSLLRRFTISKNRSFDGISRQLNSKNMTEAGNINLIDDEELSDIEMRLAELLPGQQQDMSLRKTRLAIRVTNIQFSPSGRSFACATTQGTSVYSLDDYLLFDPFDLELDVTPAKVEELLRDGEFLHSYFCIKDRRIGIDYQSRLEYTG